MDGVRVSLGRRGPLAARRMLAAEQQRPRRGRRRIVGRMLPPGSQSYTKRLAMNGYAAMHPPLEAAFGGDDEPLRSRVPAVGEFIIAGPSPSSTGTPVSALDPDDLLFLARSYWRHPVL